MALCPVLSYPGWQRAAISAKYGGIARLPCDSATFLFRVIGLLLIERQSAYIKFIIREIWCCFKTQQSVEGMAGAPWYAWVQNLFKKSPKTSFWLWQTNHQIRFCRGPRLEPRSFRLNRQGKTDRTPLTAHPVPMHLSLHTVHRLPVVGHLINLGLTVPCIRRFKSKLINSLCFFHVTV